MIADQVQSLFPDGVALPASLRVLCDYLDHHGYPISGCFEISLRGPDDVQYWFPDDEATQRCFAVFGHGSTGSVYALWLAEDPDPESAPVVLLGSEGELFALANTPAAFCRLLGCGHDELEWDDVSSPPELWDETAPLRDWFRNHLGLESPPTGRDIVAAARERHAGFAAWVEERQRQRG